MTMGELADVVRTAMYEAEVATNAKARIEAILGEKRAEAVKHLPASLTPEERKMALDVISGHPAPLSLVIAI